MSIDRLALKHELALSYAGDMVTLPLNNDEIVRKAFDLAERMFDRIEFEMKQAQKPEKPKADEFDPIEHFMNSLMASVTKSRQQ